MNSCIDNLIVTKTFEGRTRKGDDFHLGCLHVSICETRDCHRAAAGIFQPNKVVYEPY